LFLKVLKYPDQSTRVHFLNITHVTHSTHITNVSTATVLTFMNRNVLNGVMKNVNVNTLENVKGI